MILYSPDSERKLVTNLLEVDDGFPVVVLQFVEMSHADFAEVTGMIFVEIGLVMVLATGHTTTTGMLSMFANTAMAGRDVAPTRRQCISYEI